MKRILFLLLGISLFSSLQAKPITVKSPDGTLRVEVNSGKQGVFYSVYKNNVAVLTNCQMGLSVNGKVLSSQIKHISRPMGHTSYRPVVPIKFSQIEEDYNELHLSMQGNYTIVWRLYNQGVAYRYNLRESGVVEIDSEVMELGLPQDAMLHIQPDNKFTSAYENEYIHMRLSEWKNCDGGTIATQPLLIETAGQNVLIAEADHRQYPRFFMQKSDKGLMALFPRYWLKKEFIGDRTERVTEEAPYIARVEGRRSLPWRYFVIGDLKQIGENTMNACLSSDKCEIADCSWIRPGKVSWDWWNGKTVWGPDVDFQCGINTPTYKYFIDFASKNNIEYIILDEGWNTNVNRPFDVVNGLDIPELVRYGNERGVGLILWVTWYAVQEHPDIFEKYAQWGAKGMKIDFMERSDQGMSEFYENTVREAAKHHLLVDFHGAYTPAGLEFRYPNLLAYEGVRGMENNERCTPDNSIYFPFIRNAVGAMDYTPGAMLSVHPGQVDHTHFPNNLSIGTRAYQLALFITCETGTQMLADSPTRYYQNADCTEFIKDVPVLWDETIILDAKLGEYVVMAKRKGSEWYLAAETNHNPRSLDVNLNFLSAGSHLMTAFSDGPNAGYQALDYRRSVQQVDATTVLHLSLARNGGFAARIHP